MARSVAELEAEQLRLLPSQYRKMRDLLVGYAGVLRRAEISAEALAEAVTIEGAEGLWLSLLAAGYGIDRSPSEPDDSLRVRLRSVERQITPAAVLAAVEAILEAYGTSGARLVEWFEGPFWDIEDNSGFFWDIAHISGGPNTFLILVPEVGDLAALDSCWDYSFWDFDLYYGQDGESPMYGAILAEVERIRPAGTRWALAVEEA